MIRGTLDTTERSAEDLDRSMGHLEPGWYHATVTDVVEDERQSIVIHFDVGGVELREFLNDPSSAEDGKKGKKLKDRRGMFAVRLGLVPRGLPKGQVVEFNWEDAIGKKCVLQLEYGKPNAEGKTYARLTWAGIYPPDDERIPADVRAGKSMPTTASTPAATAANTSPATAATAAANGHTRPTKVQKTLDLDDL